MYIHAAAKELLETFGLRCLKQPRRIDSKLFFYSWGSSSRTPATAENSSSLPRTPVIYTKKWLSLTGRKKKSQSEESKKDRERDSALLVLCTSTRSLPR